MAVRFRFALVAALALSLCLTAGTGVGAAALPKSVVVLPTWDAAMPTFVRTADIPQVTNEYDVLLRHQRHPVHVTLTGIPLVDLFKPVGADLTGVRFVKIRFGTDNDGWVALLPLGDLLAERPPLLLSSGKRPGLGPFWTPAIVPGQFGVNPIREESIIPFLADRGPVTMIPGKPGASILSVMLAKKRARTGQYKFKPVVRNGTPGAARSVHWFGYSATGRVVDLGTKPTFTTRDATKGAGQHRISAVVTESASGSTGVAVAVYSSRKPR